MESQPQTVPGCIRPTPLSVARGNGAVVDQENERFEGTQQDLPSAPPAARSTLPPREDDWEAHRATIQQLYMSQNLTLREVMKTMRTEYGFHAT